MQPRYETPTRFISTLDIFSFIYHSVSPFIFLMLHAFMLHRITFDRKGVCVGGGNIYVLSLHFLSLFIYLFIYSGLKASD